jgi:type I restriction enzyme, S subunit
VTPEALLEQFDTMTEAPGGVERVRKVILQLAVRGRLVPQDPKDEPAASLLAADQCRVEVAPPGLDPPAGWAHVRLGELGSFIGGGTPAKSDPSLWEGNIPWVSPKDMKRLRIADSADHVSEKALSRSAVRLIQSGALLMVVRGMILARAFPVALTERPVTVNQDMKALVPKDARLAEYLLLVLRAMEPRVLAAIERSTHGTCRLESTVVSELVVPLPPLEEQRRIVARVDELMALCDELEARQQRRAGARGRANRAVLQQLTLATDDAELATAWERLHESFDALYDGPEALADLRRAMLRLAVGGRLFNCTRIDTRADARVGDFVSFQNGYAFKSEWFANEGVRLLRNVNIGHGELRWDDVVFLPGPRVSEFERFLLEPGDIVLSLDRPLISTGLKVARVRASETPALLLQRVARARFNGDAVDPDFFYLWLNSPAFTEAIDPGRSNGVPHISTREVERLPFAPPPVAEQRRIVARVDELMAVCDQLEARLTHARDHATHLAAAVVHRLTAA